MDLHNKVFKVKVAKKFYTLTFCNAHFSLNVMTKSKC